MQWLPGSPYQAQWHGEEDNLMFIEAAKSQCLKHYSENIINK